MPSRGVVAVPPPHQQIQPREEEGKKQRKKTGAAVAEARNRRVLAEIGNLVVTAPAAQGNNKLPEQPATEKEKDKVKQKPIDLQVVVNAHEKKPKAEPEVVIVLSSGESDVSGRKCRKNGGARAFTSTLTARSKAAACGLTSKPPKEEGQQKVDIDAADAHNELAVVEYLDEMYQFYKLTQDENRVHDYMGLQPEINAKMRSILVDWLIEVHQKFELMPETLYLSINLVDRFLSVKVVPRRELQLVGISSMLLASKYEEIWAPEVNDFVCISDKAYDKEKVLIMEKAILGKLGWCLTVPTCYVFLVRYIKASGPSSDEEMENMVYFLAELSLMDYTRMIHYCPSMIAASAVYVARCTLNKYPFWTATLEHYTGYSQHQLMDCARHLVTLHSGAAESKLKAVYTKFCSQKRSAVALVSPASSLTAKSAP